METLSIVNSIKYANLVCIPGSGQLISYPVDKDQGDIEHPNSPDKRLIGLIRSEIVEQENLTSWQVVLTVIISVVVVVLVITVVFLGITRIEYS